jgi:signal peptidase II
MGKIRQLKWLWITVLVLWLDFISKDLANHYLKASGVKIFSVLSLSLVHNPGAAFGLLADASGWQVKLFTVIAGLVSLFILVWLMLMSPDSKLMPVGLSLILGGALGNLYDRIVTGVVTDFIDLHYQSWSWPVFNLADSAVTVGVILLMIGLVRKSV